MILKIQQTFGIVKLNNKTNFDKFEGSYPKGPNEVTKQNFCNSIDKQILTLLYFFFITLNMLIFMY
mgnify:CR=1 FL=1